MATRYGRIAMQLSILAISNAQARAKRQDALAPLHGRIAHHSTGRG
jgi:hypothetical protein